MTITETTQAILQALPPGARTWPIQEGLSSERVIIRYPNGVLAVLWADGYLQVIPPKFYLVE